MKTPKAEVLRDLIRRLPPLAVVSSVDIPVWRTRTGVHLPDNSFSLDDGSDGLFRIGDRWRAGYHTTRWFSADAEIPAAHEDRHTMLVLDFGGETIVRIDGKIAGVACAEGKTGWVHRDKVMLSPDMLGRTVHIEVEGAVNSGEFCDAAMDGAEYLEYTLREARVLTLDRAAESFTFDCENIMSAIDCIDDEAIAARVYTALDDALHMLDFDMGAPAFLASVPAAARLLWERLGDIKYTPPGEVVALGHSHLDVAWLWTTQEIVRKTARTFSNNMALMDRYPDFCFTQSQAVLYDFMKRHYPELYERMKLKIADGSWEIIGNAWVEADTNIAGGEALIRQLLYGREFFLKEFGVSSDTYWLPDCFGFTWALPQIIARSGMKYFLTSKLHSNDTQPFPHNCFLWRAHSGHEVLACFTPGAYQGEYTAQRVRDSWKAYRQKDISDTSVLLYCYGDGGGGATYGMLENGRRLAKIPGLPAVRNGFAREFFERLESARGRLPVWDGELYYENHRGTFTSQAFVKRNNRRGEFLCRNAEAFSAFARALCGREYPAAELERVWKLLLQNQFHDILPGTSIHEVYDVCRAEYDDMNASGGALLDGALDALRARLDVKGTCAAVTNALSWSVTAPVSVELPFEAARVTDASGRRMISSVERRGGKNLLTFIAEDAAPFGFTLYSVEPEDDESSPFPRVAASASLLENELVRVTLDADGNLASVYDKELGREVLDGTGNVLKIFADKPVHESAWNLELDYRKKSWKLNSAESVEVVESSPVRGVLRVRRGFNRSSVCQDIILYADTKQLIFDTTADWHETEKLLKAEFPLAVRASNVSLEIAHGAKECPTHRNTSYDFAKFEVCGHKWADLSEGGYGAAILNDCKYGYNADGNVLGISLMRSPNCPDRTADHGVSSFVYSLFPHGGGWREGGVVHAAFELNVPLTARLLPEREGDIPCPFSLLECSAGNVVVDAVKRAQDGDGFILRVYEAETRRGDVHIRPKLPFTSVTECDMMETDETDVPCSDGGFSFFIRPHEVKTFRLR